MFGIDLFAGAGGMSMGARAMGIDVRIAVECDPHAAATYTFNHPEVDVFVGDIRNFSPPNIEARGDLIIIFGGPPCSGFSTSNQRTRTRDNPSNWLFLEFLRVVEMVRPDWLVFENVHGILQTDRGAFIAEIRTRLAQLGYTLSEAVLNAADAGVPQHRKRLFIVGSLHGVSVDLTPTSPLVPISVQEAIGDLPSLHSGAAVDWLPYRSEVSSRYARMLRGESEGCTNHLVTHNASAIIERYRWVPPGGNWRDIPPELLGSWAPRSGRGCHTGIYHRLQPDAPARVIGNFRKNLLIHPAEHRGISVREAARIQSFPDWFELKGSIGFQQQQVGNAVPPLLAASVFRSVTACHAVKGRRA